MKKLKEQNEDEDNDAVLSRRSSSLSGASSENSIIRKMNLGSSRNLTKIYKKVYADVTHKEERKRRKLEREMRNQSMSKSKSFGKDKSRLSSDKSEDEMITIET